MENGNAEAFGFLAGLYAQGKYGLPQDRRKANELWLKAGELGCAGAYRSLGDSYEEGDGVEVDMEKSKHYYELSAMGGDINARYNVGLLENEAGNTQRALRHFILAARAGHDDSLDVVKQGFTKGLVTKDEYANILRACQQIKTEMKSDARDKVTDPLELLRLRAMRRRI